MPRELDVSKLSQFEPRERRRGAEGAQEPPQAAAEPQANPWPSREPMVDGQISVKAPTRTIDRFKKMCKDDRRTYADMLRILMDAFEKDGGTAG